MDNFVFISYSSKDKSVADELYVFLQDHGVRCWMAPYSIQAGKDYAAAIVDAIKLCDAFVLIASDNVNRSEHAANELATAFDNHKPIIAFKINNVELNSEYIYYLGRKHWVDASLNFDSALEEILDSLKKYFISDNCKIDIGAYDGDSPKPFKPAAPTKSKPMAGGAELTREEICDRLKALTRKFTYSLANRLNTPAEFKTFDEIAKNVFSLIISGSYKNSPLPPDTDHVRLLVDKLSNEEHIFRIHGLPGGAKNLLLQLAFYKMLDLFVAGKSDVLPIYLSSGYYEKFDYAGKNVATAMAENIQNDLSEYFTYLSRHKEVKPVLLLEGVREYAFARIFPEKIIAELFKPYGKYSRAVTIDTGLIRLRTRLKKVIGIAGEPREDYLLTSNPIPIEDSEKIKTLIRCVSQMYNEPTDENRLYDLFKRLNYPAIDVFLVRFVSKEMNMTFGDIESVSDMYEKFILGDYQDEDRLYRVSEELYRYVFFGSSAQDSGEYDGGIWAFPNKHFTYLGYLTAYYFVHQIQNYKSLDNYDFFTVMLTSTANQFIESMFKDNYDLQNTFEEFVAAEYDKFDIRQKSNAAYWLGKMNYNTNIRNFAVQFLTKQFYALKPIVKYNNKATEENLNNHLLFRAISHGLLFCEQNKCVDEYICTVITNDIANAVNRGAAIEYYGDGYQMGEHNTYNLDVNLNHGEPAIKALCARIEAALHSNKYKFVEMDLVLLLTILQARVENDDVRLDFDVKPYVQHAIKYIAVYKQKPQNVVSTEIPCYFESVNDDFIRYIEQGSLDIATLMYNRLQHLQYVKRKQWFGRVSDPESVAEHSFGSWLLAMLFLPEECQSDGYNKREILDMLLIHDMAQSNTVSEPDSPAVTKQADGSNIEYLRKLFLKGTYPTVANLTHFYDICIKYFNCDGINAMIAHDINTVQSAYMFFEYSAKNSLNCTDEEISEWLQQKGKLTTRHGFDLFERLIESNVEFRSLLSRVIDPN